jgi:hypothetical protein
MDRSSKKEALTPQQVAQKAREVQSQGRVASGGRNAPPRSGLHSNQSASVPHERQRSSPAMSSSSLSPSVLDFARMTQTQAQAQRTAARIAELESQGKEEARNDAVMMDMDEPEFTVYPGTVARRNITVRRSRDRLSGRPDVPPRTPEHVLRRRSMDRPRDTEYGEQVSRATSAVTFQRKHAEELKGSYRVVPYPKDDPDEGYRFAGKGDSDEPKPLGHSWSRNPGRNYPGGDLQGEEGKTAPENSDSDSTSDDEDVSQEDEEIPLFLRRDIPPFEDAPGIHGALLHLWEERQKA